MIGLENSIRDVSAAGRDGGLVRTAAMPSDELHAHAGSSVLGGGARHAAARDAIVLGSTVGTRSAPAAFINRTQLEHLAQPSPFKRDEDIVREIGAAVAARRSVAAAVRTGAGPAALAEKMTAHHDLVADFMTGYLVPQRVKSLGNFGYRTYAPPVIEKHAMDFAYRQAPQIYGYPALPTRAELGDTFLTERHAVIKDELKHIAYTKMGSGGAISKISLYAALKRRNEEILADRRRGLADLT